MKILIIITGSVGCYKSLDLIRECQKKAIEYEVIATKNTYEFISKLLLEAISNKPVYSELFDLDMEKKIVLKKLITKLVMQKICRIKKIFFKL